MPGSGEARLALRYVDQASVEVWGTIIVSDDADVSGEPSVALRWVIEDGPFPPHRTTGDAFIGVDGAGEFLLRVDEEPPEEALVANEATNMDGVAVAYLMAYVDGNDNGLLDCRNPGDCDDIQIGASPNAIVVFARNAWPTEGEPLFGFNGASGVRPPEGWSLVHLDAPNCTGRPIARAWEDQDSIELVIIGDFLGRDRCERRAVNPDVD
jgi:hypothetical protein